MEKGELNNGQKKGAANGSKEQVVVQTNPIEESFALADARLVRKIDWHLLPWICLLYGLALVDRYTTI